MSERYDCDVSIIGAGIAGALVADALAEDLSVILLDAGPRVDRSEALQRYTQALIKTPESPYPGGDLYPHPHSASSDDWYVQTGPANFRSSYLKAVGGTT